MRLLRYLARIILRLQRILKRNTHFAQIELIHPSFGLTETSKNGEKKEANSLQALMYSKENEAFFI